MVVSNPAGTQTSTMESLMRCQTNNSVIRWWLSFVDGAQRELRWLPRDRASKLTSKLSNSPQISSQAQVNCDRHGLLLEMLVTSSPAGTCNFGFDR